MNTKARLLFVAAAAILMLGATGTVGAQDLQFQGGGNQTHIAPNPIAVKAASGVTTIGMNQCRFTASSVSQDISSMTLSLGTSTVDYNKIGLVRVYYSTSSFNPAALGTRIDDNNGGAGYYFTTSTLTVNMNLGAYTITTSPNNYVAIVFDFDAGQDTSKTAACVITTLVNGPNGSGVGGTHAALVAHGGTSPIDDYETTVTGTDISPVSADQTTQNVPVLKLFLDPVETTVTMDSIEVHAIGTPRDDNDVATVKLFLDDGDDTFEPGVGAGKDGDPIASTTVAGAYATLNPTANQTITAAGATYFVAVDVGSVLNANKDNVIGFEVEDPSADVVFLDVVADSYTNQKGYIVQSTPTTGGSFIITEYIPFVVVGRSPDQGETGVARTKVVRVSFGRDIKQGTVIAANFYIEDYTVPGVPIPGTTISFDVGDPKIAYLNPPGGLWDWSKHYRMFVTTGITDLTDFPLESASSWDFTIVAASPPTVSSHVPTANQTGVALDQVISVTFSEPVKNVNTGTFTVNGGAITGTVTHTDGQQTATFDPDSDLDFNTVYTVALSTGITDMDDTALSSTYSWTFTTKVRTPPTVSSHVPGIGETGVALAQVVSVTFSEPVKNVNTGTFTINGGAITGTVTHTDGQQTATFDPASDLDFDTLYTVNLSTGITDMEGTAISVAYSWSFRTKVRTPPTVVSTTPDDGSNGASRTADFTVNFSEPVWGFTTADFTLTGPSGAVAAAVSFVDGDQTATISHATLTFGASYTATIGTGIVDDEGTAMAAPYQWTFAVASAIRPVVTTVTPSDNAVGVLPSTTITATFSKSLKPSSIVGNPATPSTGFIVYVDANRNGVYDPATDTQAVPGTVAYDDPSLTATFTPQAILPYALYVARIVSGSAGVVDPNDIEMNVDYVWNFSTILDVPEPIAANNRIQPGVNDRAVIFIPEPPASAGGANARVTVQVFTPTGKRVATLVNARVYSALAMDLPLLWYGTNGLGDQLGPGLYFIRISATGWVRTLRVMVVR
jgi:hypothetical protein